MLANFWVTKIFVTNMIRVQGTWRWHKGWKPKPTFHSVHSKWQLWGKNLGEPI